MQRFTRRCRALMLSVQKYDRNGAKVDLLNFIFRACGAGDDVLPQGATADEIEVDQLVRHSQPTCR